MIAVVIPAHNEARRLGRCLKAMASAVAVAEQAGHRVEVLVVLDRCADGTAAVAQRYPVITLEVDAGNVGMARRMGATMMLERGATWLACTDADSRVPINWLSVQLASSADAVCGTVHITHWNCAWNSALRKAFASRYQHREGHRHIHGANLGVSAQAYRAAGGFRPVPCHEDVHLIESLEEIGARIFWTAQHSVATSSRLDNRVPEGFGRFLMNLQS